VKPQPCPRTIFDGKHPGLRRSRINRPRMSSALVASQNQREEVATAGRIVAMPAMKILLNRFMNTSSILYAAVYCDMLEDPFHEVVGYWTLRDGAGGSFCFFAPRLFPASSHCEDETGAFRKNQNDRCTSDPEQGDQQGTDGQGTQCRACQVRCQATCGRAVFLPDDLCNHRELKTAKH